MGYWSGNVETIPTKTSDLSDFFYDGPTPSRAVLRDSNGMPLEMDPVRIERPVWVFGDEIDVASHADEVRMAKNDGRPVLFYGTHVSDATDALGLERQGESYAPLDRLIVAWLPWDNAEDDTVDVISWDVNVAPSAVMIFRELVDATIGIAR